MWKDVVEPAGRTAWRPAHFHMIIEAEGHHSLITEIFDEQDPYLSTDAVFGVRQALVARYQTPTQGLPTLHMDIRLAAKTSLSDAA